MKCHPDTPSKLVEDFTVENERQRNDCIWIRFHVDAPVNELALGEQGEPVRRDGLWKTTCFEAFLKEAGSAPYFEFNFAPSGAWASYRFTGYRTGMTQLLVASAPKLGNDASESHFALETIFEIPSELRDKELRMAVTAVIEAADGTKSYWSATHPVGAPDFHHPDCFTLRLPARTEP